MTTQFGHLYLKPNDPILASKPNIDGLKFLINGEIKAWTGASQEVKSPILDSNGNPVTIGHYPLMGEKDALDALDASVRAWNNGRGEWAQTTSDARIKAIENFVVKLKQKRAEIVNILMWEICKTQVDSEREFDRTIDYINSTVHSLKQRENQESTFLVEEGVIGHIRRTPLGIALCLGPFNYPFNETYTTLIPAIISGNCVIMKLPHFGCLCHTPTLEIFRDCFPKGVVNVISGRGRSTMPHIMGSGKIDVFAFIGTSKAADSLQKLHPQPHRMRVVLGLEAKNPGIVMPDADLDVAVTECVSGTLSFNGQRCTALKVLFIHETVLDTFMEKFTKAVDNLKMGLPFEKDVKITPLPEIEKPEYLEQLVIDAVSKGAKIVNPRGGKRDKTFFAPTVLFPANRTMRIWNEEQFGPVIPVTTFKDFTEIFDYFACSPYGQQASLFTKDTHALAKEIDVLVNMVSRVNINSQCQRGPDSFPFTGRKDSAFGTLSVSDALRVFSIRSVVAAKASETNKQIINSIVGTRESKFLRLDYIF